MYFCWRSPLGLLLLRFIYGAGFSASKRPGKKSDRPSSVDLDTFKLCVNGVCSSLVTPLKSF